MECPSGAFMVFLWMQLFEHLDLHHNPKQWTLMGHLLYELYHAAALGSIPKNARHSL